MSEVLISDDPEPSPISRADSLEGAPCNRILSANETKRYSEAIKQNLGAVAYFAVTYWFEVDRGALPHDWRCIQPVDSSNQEFVGELVEYRKVEVVYKYDDIEDYGTTVPGVILRQEDDKEVFLPAEDTVSKSLIANAKTSAAPG